MLDRRSFVGLSASGLLGWTGPSGDSETTSPRRGDALRIKGLAITPIALPDPPLMAAGGCHGPYFLRNVVQLETDAGIIGIGETTGGEHVTAELQKARLLISGKNAFAYRQFAKDLAGLSPACYAAVELACLDACGRALNKPLCELLGGPVRDEVEIAASLCYRFAADHKQVLSDPRLKDNRGSGSLALDDFGEIRTPAAMAELAARFRQQYGFRVFKLKGGVLPPAQEVATLRAVNERFQGKYLLRIDPQARWTTPTAVKVAKEIRPLPLDYFQDPVDGLDAMAEVRRQTGLPIGTSLCVTRLNHLAEAVRKTPIDVILCDHHRWGGLVGCQALGQLTEALGWRVGQHAQSHAGVTMAAMLHLGAVVPQIVGATDTLYPWLAEGWDIIQGSKLSIRDGKMPLPGGVGLGIELDPDRLARANETYEKSGMRSRDDVATMQRFHPGWNRTLY